MVYEPLVRVHGFELLEVELTIHWGLTHTKVRTNITVHSRETYNWCLLAVFYWYERVHGLLCIVAYAWQKIEMHCVWRWMGSWEIWITNINNAKGRQQKKPSLVRKTYLLTQMNLPTTQILGCPSRTPCSSMPLQCRWCTHHRRTSQQTCEYAQQAKTVAKHCWTCTFTLLSTKHLLEVYL